MIKAIENPESLVKLVKHKISTKPLDYPIPEAIKLKLQYKDTAFFRSFTRHVPSQPQHQKEFVTMLQKATDRYKRLHNIPITSKVNRDQIFISLRRKIAMDFFKGLEMVDMDVHGIA